MKSLYDKIVHQEEKISVIGLGYVGIPVAVAFDKITAVIGFDIDERKIDAYNKGIDPTNEVGDRAIQDSKIAFTMDPARLKEAKFHIVAVPTPINENKTPNLSWIESATKLVGENLTPGSIVVYESTVYPGVTGEICLPLLEETSGLKAGVDFKVGYSPERINPGDKVYQLATIVKVVSGMDEESLETIAKVYELVVDAGVYRAESIKVAEAAKVIENAQRDINIAFVNELSIIFDRMGIDTNEVLDAAQTKWNFLPFKPGLVGGHCIGVDPYYLTYKAETLGYHPQVVLSGRRINDGMGKYVVENLIKQLVRANIVVRAAKIGILGFTFKENVPDTRNTRVMDIIEELKHYEIVPLIHDPQADYQQAYEEYGIQLSTYEELTDLDAVILAVEHDEYKEWMASHFIDMYKPGANGNKVLIDVKSQLNREKVLKAGFNYWRL